MPEAEAGKRAQDNFLTLPPSFAISFFFRMTEAQKAVVCSTQPSVLVQNGTPPSVLSNRSEVAFVAPVPKPRRRKQSQDEMIYEEIVDGDQQYQKLAHIVSSRASSGICPKPNGA